ncbi:MAG: MFS transporter [Euryarchaeota archaeon]|nr:MFS transporter [Euryarchaeota archaeon]
MSSLNTNIVMISLPTIFRGLNINPFTHNEFIYLLWILMGYSIVLATVLVTFGRLSDMYGRTRMYTLGFIIFTISSVLLSIVPDGSENTGALLLIIFRMVQAVGGGFIMVNSTALLTDSFPINERGKALGLNQSAFIVGSVLGLVAGGLLAGYNWHLVFIVNIPFALAGTLWSIFKLKESVPRKKVKIDYWGNITLASGLILISLGFTYALEPYGGSQLGWYNPWVISAFIFGLSFIISFLFIEKRADNPLFNLSLFKIRPFAFGNLSLLFNSLARGAVSFLVTIWLQGIYLPLHGYSYTETPFWAGVYMLPMMLGMVSIAPLSGHLTDKYGARIFATTGMAIVGISLYLLTLLPYNFNLLEFELIIFINGLGNGLFASPNTTSIMNSISSKDRGTGNGMRMTFNNIGATISMAIFFSITITVFSQQVPEAMYNALINILPQSIAIYISKLPPSGLLFATFLGMDPLQAIKNSSLLPSSALKVLSSPTFLPSIIGPPFINGLRISIYISIILITIGTVFSALRGKKYVLEENR